jgi:hypothetical protein
MYGDNLSTHLDLDLDLWLEEKLFDGPYRNHVYSLSNTKIRNLLMVRNVSTVGRLQLIPSTQTPEFKVILDQLVQP